ncbi:hypothetical protein T4D_2852 [Trichinella pseudospiralis]|uniref:Uncharacterized protein n=1 Tax=Trichinella pseudospiralis TaxID=6337 RepID=A0A0V1DLY9_TRIPS|nr:hypothetical protein T4D_2852 [Trichinella pseudospiralis]
MFFVGISIRQRGIRTFPISFHSVIQLVQVSFRSNDKWC